MKPCRAAVLPLALVAALVCIVPAVAQQAWQSYLNPRYGTADELPAAGFIADAAPENGDGQSWTSADGLGRLRVYGAQIAVADSAAGYRKFTLQAARDRGVDITYSAGKRGWFAYSGTVGDDIVYMKAVVSEACGTLTAHHIHLRYPAAQRERYAPIVAHMAATLHAVPVCD